MLWSSDYTTRAGLLDDTGDKIIIMKLIAMYMEETDISIDELTVTPERQRTSPSGIDPRCCYLLTLFFAAHRLFIRSDSFLRPAAVSRLPVWAGPTDCG